MKPDTVIGIPILVAPGFDVDGVDGKDRAGTAVDPSLKRVRHVKVREVIMMTVLTGDKTEPACRHDRKRTSAWFGTGFHCRIPEN